MNSICKNNINDNSDETLRNSVYTDHRFDIAGFLRNNILMILTIISFFIIGYDLTTEAAEVNNEIEYYSAILVNSTAAVKQYKAPLLIITEKTEISLYPLINFHLYSTELNETFNSRPPPII